MDLLKKPAAELLNRGCACHTFDMDILKGQLPELAPYFSERPHLFSPTTVYINEAQYRQMVQLITLLENIIQSPQFIHKALSGTSPGARHKSGPRGVFMGYDFHLGEAGPQLIEINTNAGGAFLNLELARAQKKCCTEENLFFEQGNSLEHLEETFISMFLQEWELQVKSGAPAVVAIVDDQPEAQFLYPEFQLCQRMFQRAGMEAFILDPAQITEEAGVLFHAGRRIDLIYNRLTDFYLEESNHQHLIKAHQSNNVVLTPQPYHHALYANKLNLVWLTDENYLNTLPLSADERAFILKTIPRTLRVTREAADELWKNRKNFFFKPHSGFGSKAAYRGDKLTLKTWEHILANDYVAQVLSPPNERVVRVNEQLTELKIDIRAYVYQGKVQLLASRLYSGQTTNFRTSGGGFAPVFILKE